MIIKIIKGLNFNIIILKMELNEFDYELPDELIAQRAVTPRDHSKLMVLKNGKIEHKHFYEIIDYLSEGDVLVVNHTKVAKAKIKGRKETGGKVEIILENESIIKSLQEPADKFLCRIKGSNVKPSVKIIFDSTSNTGYIPDNFYCEVLNKENDVFTIKFNKKLSSAIIDKYFKLPLPPYIKQDIREEDEYQTVYSTVTGSVAAPTAGLHFTNDLLRKIEAKGVIIARVCLHVGFGTFLPIRNKIKEHKMHAEYYEIDEENAKKINERKGKLYLVGTTTVRVIESVADNNGIVHARHGTTDIFIYPGYKFKVNFDGLITNFHLPKSTLLLLVSAYYGKEKILNAYNIAVQNKYRFYSLGDAMFLVK